MRHLSISNFKYYIFTIIILFLVLHVLHFLIVPQIEQIKKVDRVYEASEDLIVLGSSRSQGSIIMDSLGCEYCYNYSIDGTANKIWLGVLPDLLRDSINQLILVSVDDCDSIYLKANTDGDYTNYWLLNKNTDLYRNLNKDTRKKLKPFPFYLFGEGYTILWKFLRERMDLTAMSSKGSRIELNILSEDQFNSSVINFKKETVPGRNYIDEAALVYLLEISKLISKSDDLVIFMNLPNYINKRNEFYSDLHEFYIDNNDALFWDLSAKESMSRDDFFDAKHLSQDGAGKISVILRERLKVLSSNKFDDLTRRVD